MDRKEILWRVRSLCGSQIDILRGAFNLYPRLEDDAVPDATSFSAGFRCSLIPDEDRQNGVVLPSIAWRDRLLEKADRIMRDRMSIFDLEDQFLGNPIEWHKDFSADITGPLKHSTFVDYRDFEQYGDCKLVWEPNRHHQLVVLARAYAVTGDQSYAQKVIDLMLDWINSNPFGYGMNWKSPLEVGIRLINWTWSIDIIRHSGAFDDQGWNRIVQTIYRAVWDTQRKFSQGSSANNHLVGEAAGVFIACTYFNFLPNATDWRNESKLILEREILAQTYADGCTREHAFGYQFFIVQFFALAKIAGDRSKNPFSEDYDSRLHEMYKFLAELSADTSRPPNCGDADDGYVLDLGDLPENSFELITVAAYLFHDPSLMLTETSESVFWLFGNDHAAMQYQPIETTSTAYEDSGYYILRSSQCDQKVSVFFDCADLGYGSIAAHGHADCLSFVLSVDGNEVFVDSGTYDYFSHPDWRNHFRKTKAHNTLTVDGECQSVSTGPFMWAQHANSKLLEWNDADDVVRVCGEHGGYQRLTDPTTHERAITLDKTTGSVDIIDRIKADNSHQIKRYLHLAPECSVSFIAAKTIRIIKNNIKVVVTTDAKRIKIVRANDEGKIGWISRGYHRRTASQCLTMEDDADGNREFRIHIDVGLRSD